VEVVPSAEIVGGAAKTQRRCDPHLIEREAAEGLRHSRNRHVSTSSGTYELDSKEHLPGSSQPGDSL
jgi:hypothetical protein